MRSTPLPMVPDPRPTGYARTRAVTSFAALLATPLDRGINALCWPRVLPAGFDSVVAALGDGEGIVPLEEERLLALDLPPAGRAAVAWMLADFHRLRDQGLDPVLNCIYAYPHDDPAALVATDVYSYHADRAPIAADTWLCTYPGTPSEALRQEDARRKVDDPAIRTRLLADYGGADDAGFLEFLADNCYDLHYAARPGAQPFSFGQGHLWRIAVEFPGNPVPPCVHRAPLVGRESPPRLLLIS